MAKLSLYDSLLCNRDCIFCFFSRFLRQIQVNEVFCLIEMGIDGLGGLNLEKQTRDPWKQPHKGFEELEGLRWCVWKTQAAVVGYLALGFVKMFEMERKQCQVVFFFFCEGNVRFFRNQVVCGWWMWRQASMRRLDVWWIGNGQTTHICHTKDPTMSTKSKHILSCAEACWWHDWPQFSIHLLVGFSRFQIPKKRLLSPKQPFLQFSDPGSWVNQSLYLVF